MQHTPYSVARLDGAVLFNTLQAGLMTTGFTKSPIVHFKVLAGIQQHPVWSLDRTAIAVYSYCETARRLKIGNTQLQVNIMGSWVSSDDFSNIIATHIEWHTSKDVRDAAEKMIDDLARKNKSLWPVDSITIPVQK